MFIQTCANSFNFSMGAVAVLDMTPAKPPANMAFHNKREAGGSGGGAKSAPIH